MEQYSFSILTPTYNRANLLYRLAESLYCQDYNDFEWIIVDDGSTDDTEKVVKELIKKYSFKINYIKKENGGKPSAHNEGVKNADSELTIICDDDDYFVLGKLKDIANIWNKYKREEVGGIIAHRGYNEKEIIGRRFPDGIYADIKKIFKTSYYDTVQIYKTDLLKRNLFPITPGEKFVPEVWLWNTLDKNYKLILMNDVVEICNYRNDGLTKTNSQTMWNNPIGYSYYFKQCYDECVGLSRIKYYAAYAKLREYKGYPYEKAPLLIDWFSRPIQWFIGYKLKEKENDK